MNKWMMMGVAAAAVSFTGGVAHASDHTGVSLALGASQVDAGIKYTGGKPNADMSGDVGELAIGADYQFGNGPNGFVVGARYTASLGDGLVSPANHDGNYLVQGAELAGYTQLEARVGYALGPVMPYLAAGSMSRDERVWQDCPADHNAVPFGFCAGGGNATLADQREGRHSAHLTDDASMWRAGIEVNVTDHLFIDASYWRADFGTVRADLASNPSVVPPTNPNQDFSGVNVRAAWRF